MKKTIFFMAMLAIAIAIFISSCQTSGVIVAESDTDRGSSDGPRKMRIANTDTTRETDTIIIVITGQPEYIDRLTKAANLRFKMHYVLKGVKTPPKPKNQGGDLKK